MDAVSAANGGRAGGFERRKGGRESCQQYGDLCSFGGGLGLGAGGEMERGGFAKQPTLSQVAVRKPHCSLGPLRWNAILQPPWTRL